MAQLGLEDGFGLISESLKRFMSTGLGSSSRRMMRITSSRFR